MSIARLFWDLMRTMSTIANRISKTSFTYAAPTLSPLLLKAQADVDLLLNDLGVSEQLLDATAKLANALEREHLLRLQFSLRYLASVSPQVMAFTGEEIPHGATKAVIAAVEMAQSSLQTAYEQNLSAAAGRINPKIHDLTNVVNAELEKMFDQLEVVRWAALEAEVDEDLAAGRFKTFGSASAAFAYLDKRAKKHTAKVNS